MFLSYCINLALFSGPALQRIKESGLERMYVTDTLEPKANENEASGNKVVRISVGKFIFKCKDQEKKKISKIVPNRGRMKIHYS